VLTQDRDPQPWAMTSFNLAIAYEMQGRPSEARLIAQQALLVFERIGHQSFANAVRRFLLSEQK
jgi:hypothetical protein